MKVLVSLIVSAVSWLLVAWYFMLAVGIARLHWLPSLPTIGYSTSLVIALLLNFVLDGASTRAYYDDKVREGRS